MKTVLPSFPTGAGAPRRLPDPLPADFGTVRRLLDAQGDEQDALYAAADAMRAREMGDEIFLRGIIEFSNYCARNCDYCGIRGAQSGVRRYRMTPDEIAATAARARGWGCTTVVLQSGEDPWFTTERLETLLRRIKTETGLAITLSIGERPAADWRAFRAAGADRCLLRFETSDRALFARLHPDDDFDARLQCLRDVRAAGLQVGSGFMIGLPFSDLDLLARDLLFATALELDMIGCGPFLAAPGTPLEGQPQLPDREVYFKVIALLRLLNPRAHIPATTAFDALCEGGRDLCLARGANVFMPNITPAAYREMYQLYPNKPCVDEDGAQCAICVRGRVARLGRRIGTGPGHTRRNPEFRG